jgi:hypothetical protein
VFSRHPQMKGFAPPPPPRTPTSEARKCCRRQCCVLAASIVPSPSPSPSNLSTFSFSREDTQSSMALFKQTLIAVWTKIWTRERLSHYIDNRTVSPRMYVSWCSFQHPRTAPWLLMACRCQSSAPHTAPHTRNWHECVEWRVVIQRCFESHHYDQNCVTESSTTSTRLFNTSSTTVQCMIHREMLTVVSNTSHVCCSNKKARCTSYT